MRLVLASANVADLAQAEAVLVGQRHQGHGRRVAEGDGDQGRQDHRAAAAVEAQRDGEQPEPEKKLNNNIIFRKLKIALDYKDEQILETLALAGFPLGKHELSAFFRKPGHHNYRECQGQVLRNFLKGLQISVRGAGADPDETAVQ